MNRERRQKLRDAIKLLDKASEIVNECSEEEEEAADNLPESLQESDMYDELESNAELLNAAAELIERAAADITDIIE